jgi:DNA-binding NarL/FixJ family response regulator
VQLRLGAKDFPAWTMGASLKNCVLLVDRHHELSEGVRDLLATAFAGVFTVAEESSLLEGAARIQPVMVVADLAFAGGDIAGFVAALRRQAPAAKVLLFTVHDEPTVVRAAVSAGADGVVLTRSIATDLLPALDALLAGQSYVSPLRADDVRTH